MKVYLNAYERYFEIIEIKECVPKSESICEVLIKTGKASESYADGWWLVNRDNIKN